MNLTVNPQLSHNTVIFPAYYEGFSTTNSENRYGPNPNDPIYKFGQVVVRPVIDAVAEINSHFFNAVSTSFSFVTDFFASIPNFIPGAYAASIRDDYVESKYIVILKEEKSDKLHKLIDRVEALGGKIGYIYTRAFTGFSVETTPETLEMLENNSDIEFIENVQIAEVG